jgi:hypothetical protein
MSRSGRSEKRLAGEVSPANLNLFLHTAEQGLLDLAACGASDVVFVHVPADGAPPPFDALERVASSRGFVVCRVEIGPAQSFEALDDVVRAFIRALSAPGHPAATSRARRGGGLVTLLDAFLAKHGARALDTFDACVAEVGFAGDLHDLARAYIAADRRPRHEVVRLEAWLSGTELSRSPIDDGVAALSNRTAKRALIGLSRLVRALGHAGLVLIATGAETLSHLTVTRREIAYTVLRELIDNGDGAPGLVATRLYVAGGPRLFEGAHSLKNDPALASRVLHEGVPRSAPIPHAPLYLWTAAKEDPDPTLLARSRAPAPPTGREAAALRTLVRSCQGLPSFDLLESLTVGYESIDLRIDELFSHAARDGSVFAVVSGPWGSGKTHLVLHLAARALAENRPVLRLPIERLDTDLGNPQRHLRRLLEMAVLPNAKGMGPLDRLAVWTRSVAATKRLVALLEEIAASDRESAAGARRALRAYHHGDLRALESTLGAADLVHKPASAGYRHDAYGRLLLWLELFERLEESSGPLVVIDEAENLYRGGTRRSERRTALRTLAFYCGGTLPRACVVLAVTPDTLSALREESAELLDEVEAQKTVLAWEDATMLRRRLLRSRPFESVRLDRDQLTELASRVRRAHARVRGKVADDGFDDFLARLVASRPTPRRVIKDVVERLESLHWIGFARSE